MLFDLQRRTVGDTELVSVVGDVDLASLPSLAAALTELRGEVTVDLGGVDYLDPICLGAFLAADVRVRRSGGRMTVRAGGAVLSLLEETRVSEILTVIAG